MTAEHHHGLFSYGTLQQADVQIELFGRRLDGEADVLTGFAVGLLEISDGAVVPLSGEPAYLALRPGGADDRVAGMVLAVTDAELAVADDYEAEDYRRIVVTLESGREAFVYIAADEGVR
jgi:gamma-glutamylcyclotransferase (GGCT)/AIG2-like uncharacterized protein YtfP